MMRIKTGLLIMVIGFMNTTHAMDPEVVKKIQGNHSKMIEALTFDATKGRYYYKPIFKRTGKGVYSSMLMDFPKDQACIDLGPAKLFWILRGRKLVKASTSSIQDDLYVEYDKDQRKRFGNDDYPLIPQAQQRVNDFKELGALEYDSVSGVYFHAKKFVRKASLSELGSDDECLGDRQYDSDDDVYYRPRLKKSQLAEKMSAVKSGSGNDDLIIGDLNYDPEVGMYFFSSYTKEDLAAAQNATDLQSASGDDASSPECESDEDNMDIEEWLLHVSILSFDREKRRYCYKYLFEGNRDQQGLKLSAAPATIDCGPLGCLVTDLDYRGYDNFRGLHFSTPDHTRKLLEKNLGNSKRDKERRLLYHTKVFDVDKP